MFINQDPIQVLHTVNIICALCSVNKPVSHYSPDASVLEPSPDKDPDILAARFITSHYRETGHDNFLTQSSIISTVRYIVRE